MRKKICLFILMVIVGIITIIEYILLHTKKKEAIDCKRMSDKHLELMLLLNQWLKIKQEEKKVEDYFYRNRIKTIAIYGMSYIGERLFEELKNTDIEIKYAIDKNNESIYVDIDVLSVDEVLPKVDAIIVTPVYFFDEIKDMLQKKTVCRIIYLEDVIYKL